ncbi:MAG: FAD-binding oxidoreductase [Thermomicrobia bacterium]|nr:FAD-binding oxidoreductase [Thermomicrobia bacterium]
MHENETRDGALPHSSEVVVIGGGFIGCSITYQLAKRGVDVTLVEQEHLAWGASGRNAGQVSPAAGYTDLFLPFTVANFAMLGQMEAELDADFQFRLSGGMELATTPEGANELHESAASLRAAGWHADVLSGDAARKIVPALGPAVIAARYVRESGHLMPMLLAYAFARAARRCGARICIETTVTGIDRDPVGIASVQTSRGPIATRAVVNATNGWAARIGAMVGLSLPIQPQRGQILVTAPMPPILPTTFGYWAEQAVHYWRQTPGGQIVIGGGRAYDAAGIGSYSRATTPDILRRFPAHVASTMPALASLPVVRAWGGTMGFTPDYGPLIGAIESVPGFFVAAGFNGNGTPWSCIAGLLIAQHICEEPSDFLVERVRPDRFATSAPFAAICDHANAGAPS